MTGGPASPDAPVEVRPVASRAEWDAVRELCCRTGNAGDPIDRARWPLFAEVWVGPYQRLVPGWTYVAVAGGVVVGYLTGCPDSAAFRRARRWRVTLPVLLGILAGRYGWTPDARRFVHLALRVRRGAESALAGQLPPGFAHDYPAHLHMNVNAPWRRRRVGAALMARFTADLAAVRIAGVHLFCGAGPRPFYLRQGFRELGSLRAASGQVVYAMGRRLGPPPDRGPGRA